MSWAVSGQDDDPAIGPSGYQYAVVEIPDHVESVEQDGYQWWAIGVYTFFKFIFGDVTRKMAAWPLSGEGKFAIYLQI